MVEGHGLFVLHQAPLLPEPVWRLVQEEDAELQELEAATDEEAEAAGSAPQELIFALDLLLY